MVLGYDGNYLSSSRVAEGGFTSRAYRGGVDSAPGAQGGFAGLSTIITAAVTPSMNN